MGTNLALFIEALVERNNNKKKKTEPAKK